MESKEICVHCEDASGEMPTTNGTTSIADSFDLYEHTMGAGRCITMGRYSDVFYGPRQLLPSCSFGQTAAVHRLRKILFQRRHRLAKHYRLTPSILLPNIVVFAIGLVCCGNWRGKRYAPTSDLGIQVHSG